MKRVPLVALSAAVFSASGPATAVADRFVRSPAVYVGLGAANTSLDDDNYYRDVFSDLNAGSPTVDDEDSGAHLFGGFRFNEYFALELGTRDLGQFKASSPNAVYKQDFGVATLSAVGSLPLGKYVSLYGQAGFGTIVANEKLSIDNFRARNDAAAGTATLGAGLELRPMGENGLALRLGWQSYFFRVRYDRYYVSGSGNNVQVFFRDENDYAQRIDTYGVNIAYFFSL